MALRIVEFLSFVALVLSIASTAYWLVSKGTEPFTINPKTVKHVERVHCQYQADAGEVCPLIVTASDYDIKPFNHHSAAVQDATVAALNREWPDSFTRDSVARYFAYTDTMYVMTDKSGDFIGAVAVDRKKFFPFISNLYVRPEQRGKGRSQRLLDVAEAYAASFGVTTVKLWCEPRLIPFYEKRGYRVESTGDPTVMTLDT